MRYLKGYTGLLTVLIVLVVVGTGPVRANTGQDEAITSYHLGIAAKSIGEREQYFEKALELYLANYNTMKQGGAINGLLCYNIGNCYFNLGQNESAIFYYQLGKKLLPSNRQIAANLAEALAKRKNPVDIEAGGLLESLLFFHYKIAPFQQMNLLIGAAILAAISLAWLLVKPNITVRYIAIFSGLVASCFFASLAFEYYMPSHVGILMRQSDIRRGAGIGFAPITARPFGGGSSIKVLSLADGWYSVKLNDGRMGFVEQEDLKLIAI